MSGKDAISVIVPTLNESENIPQLFRRIDASLSEQNIPYEIIIVDDHSSDNTVQTARNLSDMYNVTVIMKQGEPGKAFSLLEGFDAANHSLICMIDADLQYPPESISPMHQLLTDKKADLVVSERNDNETSFVRKLSSKVFNLIFVRMLFGIGYDTQSGLKLFRKNILRDFKLDPSPWSFDLEFLVRSLENKRLILSVGIPFSERSAGVTKVKLLSTTYELAKASLKLRLNTSIQKLRAGHEVNSIFLKRVFPLAVSLLLFGITFLAPAQKTEALSVRDVVQGITSALSASQPEAAPTDSAEPTVTTAVQPSDNETQSGQNSTLSAATNTQPTQTTTAKATSPLTVQSQHPEMAAITRSSNNPALTAATANQPYSDYAQGYPVGTLNPTTRSTLSTLSKTALIAGIASLLIGATTVLAKTYRGKLDNRGVYRLGTR